MHVLGSPHAFLHCIFFSCIHSHSLVFGLVSLLGLLSLVGSCYLTSVLIHGLVSDLLSPLCTVSIPVVGLVLLSKTSKSVASTPGSQ